MIYADYASTTPLDADVKNKIDYCNKFFGNTSSVHAFGREAKELLEKARKDIATAIGCKKSEIYFTSGGTEADNWALFGTLNTGDHLITTAIEHHAIINVAELLKTLGVEVTYVLPDKDGVVLPSQIESAIKENTRLISVMSVNNETGAIQPIDEIARLANKKGIAFHTDATQAVGKIPFNVKEQKIKMLSASAHKFFGPKGIGFLFVDESVKIKSFLLGGAQEKDRRAGTVNMPGAVGMAEALKKQLNNKEEYDKQIKKVAKIIKKHVLSLDKVKLNSLKGIDSIMSFSFLDINVDSLLVKLDLEGIACSTGAACSAGSVSDSHVLLAMPDRNGYPAKALRVSISHLTTVDEAEIIGKKIVEAVIKMRK